MVPFRIIGIAALVALAGALVVAATILLVRGNSTTPIQILGPTPHAASSEERSAGTRQTQIAGQRDIPLRIYITGAVRNPGVYALQAGDRLVDGLSAAGGATEDADLVRVNLARRVQDGEQYHIPRIGETASTGVTPVTDSPVAHSYQGGSTRQSDAPTNSEMSKGLINLNTASVDSLITLPDIGPVRAKAIVDYRERNGRFRSVEEITNVPGIGPATYESIRHLVTVDGQR